MPPPPRWIRPSHCLFALFLFLIVVILPSINAQIGQQQNGGRFKRQYAYDDSYYNGYYGWQAGRIVGWLIGFFVLLLFICIPCLCCIGIWFLGWFGLRQAMANRRARRGGQEGRVIAARDQREIHARRYIDAPSPVATEQRYVYATDRYYERRPRSPQTGGPNESGGPYASNGVVTRETRRL